MARANRISWVMSAPDPTKNTERREYSWALVLFCLALAFHAWGATVGWKNLNLPGCEFRQTQTAISAFFIQRENNFSLAYPTPVLGKPWSIPMEFPLYQWTVVVVSNVTGVSLTSAGRAVSLGCFYAALPALFLLLGHIGLVGSRRLLALGLVLTCPLYIFYARSFLIETMALLFGAWFLVGYVRAMERRRWSWLGLAALMGAACGLVKVTTYMFFLMPAFIWTLWWFWQDWQQPRRFSALARRCCWGAMAVALPFAASVWWVHYSDAIKELSEAGRFLVSARMSGYNFGVGSRFLPEIWHQHWQILFDELSSVPVLAACALLALVFARHRWKMIGLLVFLFFVVQLVFPILYAWHAYYYVASAFTLMLALGLVLCGVLESRLPRLIAWAVILAVYGWQMNGYVRYYYPTQKELCYGTSALTVALQRVTAPDDAIVIAGNDWSSMTPYYAQRRAFMIRRNIEHTWEMIVPAFAKLKEDETTALILHGEQANNQTLIDLAVRDFGIDPRPAFRWGDVTVLLHAQIRGKAVELLRGVPEIELLNPDSDISDRMLRREILYDELLKRCRDDFNEMNPKPFKYYTTFGTARNVHEGRPMIYAHPDTILWFKLGGGKRTLKTEVRLEGSAYDEKLPLTDQSDGVEVWLEEEIPGGGRKPLYSRWVNPRDNVGDRGVVQIEADFELAHDCLVVLTIGPGPHRNYSRDWASLGRVEIK